MRGGQSNPTYKLITPHQSYVLRRKPSGPLLPGAHDVEREARILTALGGAHFPVAHVYAQCLDASVLGSPFFVMQMVEGRIFWDATFPQVAREERRAYFDAMNMTLATLHRIDYAALGLSDFGKPGNYFARQIARWSRQYVQDSEAGRDENMDRLLEWLPDNIPDEDQTSIAHGDFAAAGQMSIPVFEEGELRGQKEVAAAGDEPSGEESKCGEAGFFAGDAGGDLLCFSCHRV